jgi:RNA polymerase sigma-70 factor, ECF subfamily
MENKVDLLVGLKEGKESAFRLIMETWYSRLFNFARGYIADEELVREILQDVFLQLWSKRSTLAENSSLNAYLFTITRNRCIDHIRRKRLELQFQKNKQEEFRRMTESYQSLTDSVLDHIIEQELQDEIGMVIDSLPEQCRKVFTLSRYEGLKNREIGEVLNISEKTVETHITKALRTIRNALEKKFSEKILILFNFFFRKSLPKVSQL